jgi:isopentenyl phosphate kinase
MGKSLVVVKIGGSVVTNKDEPLSPNKRNIRLICNDLSKALSKDMVKDLFLIHGGGSFGHYYAKKFSIGTKAQNGTSPEGLARTSAAMLQLHSIVLEELCNAGVYCTTMLPVELLNDSLEYPAISDDGVRRINSSFDNHLIPISFGFVNLRGSESYIVSGDKIALAVARSFSVTRTIFAMDVDGVYPSADLKGPVINELSVTDSKFEDSLRSFDVTGGIRAKISTGFELSKYGTDVLFLNGREPGRLSRAIQGEDDVVATRIYSTKNSGRHSE